MSGYSTFLERKSQLEHSNGFEPVFMPEMLFPFQRALVEWAVRKGRAAIFADCGLGKTPMQLVWAENVARRTGLPVLILAPLAVGAQTVQEGEKFGIECRRSRDGSMPGSRIVVTNYEQLHRFDPRAFGGVVCDESSILKHFAGATQKAVTRFMCKTPYRLLCTATAAPNDYVELGTSSEALGGLGHSDMLSRFFQEVQNKPHRLEDVKRCRNKLGGELFAKLSFRVAQNMNRWRLKGHAHGPFWRWVCSWARACRAPSDLGFEDDGFVLPPLVVNEHTIEPSRPADGMLFTLPALGLHEEREERRRTLEERCSFVAELVDHKRPAVVWCHLNAEGDRLEKLIPDAVQIKGSNSDEEKEEAYRAFAAGELRVLVTKPKLGAWGLNWQHCSHVVTFATHSYEQYYQAVRRCWRFGQKHPVSVDVVFTEAERRVRENMILKSEAAAHMFTEMIAYMNQAQKLSASRVGGIRLEVPSWV